MKPLSTVLITGANTGIGRELALQLARKPSVDRLILACRDPAKAAQARSGLESQSGRRIFEVLPMDLSDLASVAAAAAKIDAPVDALVMNAGGLGGARPLDTTAAGVSMIFAANLLGHAALAETLIGSGRLRSIALMVGSEAARGVPKLGIRRPRLQQGSVEEFVSIADGSWFQKHRFDRMLAYAQVKMVAALWTSALARRHSSLRAFTVSPGNTYGTDVMSPLPWPLRPIAQNIIMPLIAPRLGLAHSLETGTARLSGALFDNPVPSGGFYASAAPTITGPLVDQTSIYPALGDASWQDHAFAAVGQFLTRGKH